MRGTLPSTFVTAQGGFPFTASMSGDINGDGLTDRPDLVGPVSYNTRNRDCYVIDNRNPACNTSGTAFVNLPAGAVRFGSEGRDTIIGPGLFQADVSAGKSTRFGKDERFNLQFRWDFQNAFHNYAFSPPTTQVDFRNPQLFGKLISDVATANIQGEPLMNLQLRLSW